MNCEECGKELIVRSIKNEVCDGDYWICTKCNTMYNPDYFIKSNCERSEKTNVDVHTCTPTGTWRKGMDEGYLQALDDIRLKMKFLMTCHMSPNDSENFQEYYYDDSFNDLLKLMFELKQGKSDE